MAHTGGLDRFIKGRVIILDFFKPFGMNISPCPLIWAFIHIAPFPCIFILSRRSTPIPSSIERRIGSDEINCLAVHPSKHRQVVHFIKHIIWKVLICHYDFFLIMMMSSGVSFCTFFTKSFTSSIVGLCPACSVRRRTSFRSPMRSHLTSQCFTLFSLAIASR